MRMTMLISYATAALVLYGCGRVSLETRTFELRYLDPGTALGLIHPYVYADREGAPGVSSAVDRAITIRETADNLDRIGRVLEQYDVSPPTISLQFQLIEGNGNEEEDPRIAEVEEQLRRLFRFDGYRLITETAVTTLAGREFSQVMFGEASPSGGVRFPDGAMIDYRLSGAIGPLQGARDSARIELHVELQSLFGASVGVPLGHTVVLGTTQLPSRAIILTVRAQLTESRS